MTAPSTTNRIGLGWHYTGVCGVFMFYCPATSRFRGLTNSNESFKLMDTRDITLSGTTLTITL